MTETQFTSDPLQTPLQRVPQAIALDAQVWVQQAILMAETSGWRLRSTDIDNAPEGRAVYWSSGWALWLEACGRVRKAFTSEPLPRAIEQASAWANLPLFLAVMTIASICLWKRWGGGAGALTAVALVGQRGFYAGFYPAYSDHHGLINSCVLGAVLGALLMGAGWWRRIDFHENEHGGILPESEAAVMRAATVSAICGALGLWVSAASLVVTIAFIGLAGLLVGLCQGTAGLVCVPAAWRHWGRIGGLMCAGFYLLENFPDRIGLRMEVNHPLYGLAWWAAGEGIAAVLARRTESRSVKWLAVRLFGWGALIASPAALVWARGGQVFIPMDAFHGRINSSIHELRPFLEELSRAGPGSYRDQLWIMGWLAIAVVLWLGRKPTAVERMSVGFVGSIAAAAIALGFYQNRWLLTAGAPQVLMAVLLTVVFFMRLRGWLRWLLIGSAGCIFVQGPWILARERMHVERVRDVQFGETVQLLYRDIAGFLGKAGADQNSILLSDPNASVSVGYYGRLRTVGTLYWENRDGLLAAAEILSARDEADAAARIYARRITHVVLVSSYDFLPEYNYALRGGGGPFEDRTTLGYRLLYGHQVPVWLRPLNYRVPAPLAPLGFKVALFTVDFEAPAAVAHERIGRYQLSLGERRLAETSFMAAMTADPSRPEAWLRLGELALASGRMKEAFNFIRAGIERAPVGERERLRQSAAALFRRQGPEGAAQADALLGLPAR